MLDCWQESGYDMSKLGPDNDILAAANALLL